MVVGGKKRVFPHHLVDCCVTQVFPSLSTKWHCCVRKGWILPSPLSSSSSSSSSSPRPGASTATTEATATSAWSSATPLCPTKTGLAAWTGQRCQILRYGLKHYWLKTWQASLHVCLGSTARPTSPVSRWSTGGASAQHGMCTVYIRYTMYNFDKSEACNL